MMFYTHGLLVNSTKGGGGCNRVWYESFWYRHGLHETVALYRSQGICMSPYLVQARFARDGSAVHVTGYLHEPFIWYRHGWHETVALYRPQGIA